MIKRFIFVFVFILGIIYIALPSPQSRDQIPSLPDSLKSDEPGDTTQNPNNLGFYSDHRRTFITSFYFDALKKLDPVGNFLPPLKLNYPPEDAFTYVRDQEKSTFLEEYTYPLRESLFVNGFEPLVKNGRPIDQYFDFVVHEGKFYNSKTTLRIYSTSLYLRLFIYLCIWALLVFSTKLYSKVLRGID